MVRKPIETNEEYITQDVLSRMAEKKAFNDPLKFIKVMFDWKLKGGPLENEEGPDIWQEKILNIIKKDLIL